MDKEKLGTLQDKMKELARRLRSRAAEEEAVKLSVGAYLRAEAFREVATELEQLAVARQEEGR